MHTFASLLHLLPVVDLDREKTYNPKTQINKSLTQNNTNGTRLKKTHNRAPNKKIQLQFTAASN
jgi:hypothetical protein